MSGSFLRHSAYRRTWTQRVYNEVHRCAVAANNVVLSQRVMIIESPSRAAAAAAGIVSV